MTIFNWLFCVATPALIFLAVTSGNELFERPPVRPASAPIESPLHNTCQSGDLWPDVPKCKLGSE